MAESDPQRQGITGRQSCHLAVPGMQSAAQLSVVSFTTTEQMGEPNVVQIDLTHPQPLPRTDYLNLDATFTIEADDGTVRRFTCYI